MFVVVMSCFPDRDLRRDRVGSFLTALECESGTVTRRLLVIFLLVKVSSPKVSLVQ